MILWNAKFGHSIFFLLFVFGASISQGTTCKILAVSSKGAVTSPRLALEVAVKKAFVLGPNRWVLTGLTPNGMSFQRGLSGGMDTGQHGAKEFLDLLEGRSFSMNHHIFVLPETETDPIFDINGSKGSIPFSAFDSLAGAYASPIAIRGRVEMDPIKSKVGYNLEWQLPAGTNISNKITEIGFFFRGILTGRPAYIWTRNFLKIVEELSLSTEMNSRGADFYKKLRNAVDRVEPEVEELVRKWWEASPDDRYQYDAKISKYKSLEALVSVFSEFSN